VYVAFCENVGVRQSGTSMPLISCQFAVVSGKCFLYRNSVPILQQNRKSELGVCIVFIGGEFDSVSGDLKG
jgi:hypothetical protein